MARTDYRSVDEYFAAQPEGARLVLRRVRSIVKKAIPGAEEAISYQIPAFKQQGVWVLALAAWKRHYSIYPAPERLVATFKGKLDPYKASKGTLRFPLSEPVPEQLIERIAKWLAKYARERARAKGARSKKRPKPSAHA